MLLFPIILTEVNKILLNFFIAQDFSAASQLLFDTFIIACLVKKYQNTEKPRRARRMLLIILISISALFNKTETCRPITNRSLPKRIINALANQGNSSMRIILFTPAVLCMNLSVFPFVSSHVLRLNVFPLCSIVRFV